MEGYPVKRFDTPTKRYCQTLKLKDAPELIAEYERLHSPEYSWKEIRDGIGKLRAEAVTDDGPQLAQFLEIFHEEVLSAAGIPTAIFQSIY